MLKQLLKKLNAKSTKVFEQIIAQLDGKNHIRIDNTEGAYMPVVVEFLYNDDLQGHLPNGKRYSIAHYYTCNGDAMRDPDIEFIYDGENVYPVYFMQDGGFSIRDDVFSYNNDGTIRGYFKSRANDIKDFCNMWMMNIKEQQSL